MSEGKRVLLVDDNEDATVLLGMALETSGHEVRIAANAPAALEIVAQWQPEIAILDIGLPSVDGYELAQSLRSIPALRDIALIALTGYGTVRDRDRAEQAGFDHHLTKPVAMPRLTSILREVVAARNR